MYSIMLNSLHNITYSIDTHITLNANQRQDTCSYIYSKCIATIKIRKSLSGNGRTDRVIDKPA